MQYLLTVEEYKALHQKIDDKKRLPSKEKLQEFCTKIANELPIDAGWFKGIWGCILTDDSGMDHYCDHCPAQDVCPNEHKEWSK